MKTIVVQDIMVPLSEYATVSEETSLYEALLALEKAQIEFGRKHYGHKAILVYDKDKQIVGKLGQRDVLKALEPKYGVMRNQDNLSGFGFSKKFLNSMIDQFKLWDKPLDKICQKVSSIKTKDIMHTPGEGEYVNKDETMDIAIHQLVMGHHQSLLVTEDKKIVGILRLIDVFIHICLQIKKCNI